MYIFEKISKVNYAIIFECPPPPPPRDTCSNDRGETLGISGKAQLVTEPSSVNEPGTSLLWANLHIMEKYLHVLFLIFFNFHLPFFYHGPKITLHGKKRRNKSWYLVILFHMNSYISAKFPSKGCFHKGKQAKWTKNFLFLECYSMFLKYWCI